MLLLGWTLLLFVDHRIILVKLNCFRDNLLSVNTLINLVHQKAREAYEV